MDESLSQALNGILLQHPTLWKVMTGLECILMMVRQER